MAYRLRIFFLCVWFLGLSGFGTGMADTVAYLCNLGYSGVRANVLKMGGACIGVEFRDEQGRVRKTIKNLFEGSGTILVTKDGRSVVFVQSWPYARLTADGRVQVNGRGGDANKDAVGIVFVRDGKVVASHRLTDLLLRPRMVTVSTSHVSWLRNRDVLEQPLGTTLELETLSMRRLIFDIATGRLRSAENTALWKSCDVIGYGEVKETGQGFVLDPGYMAKGGGLARPPIHFRTTPGSVPQPDSYQTVCLKREADGLLLHRALDLLLNGLTVR